ncbi:MAG TPA: tRNA 2-selenouridine(34) synthase MnmH [Thiomicrospira sp.]|nr:tRNA 2-selenouridine(34) synthase MnmH [Thiomicrospira sp.]
MDDFKSIVLNQTPLIDVRAPVEFLQGAFTLATNLPLMNDEERQKVGLCYKQNGNAAAVKLGHQLVNEGARAPRVESWAAFMDAHPDALLYCFRGGMRSKISQQWLKDSGREIVRLKGGYKAFRRYLIDYLDSLPKLLIKDDIKPVVVAGRTGSGKTLVIHQLNNAIDLEGLAHHRGSAFGRHATPQPTQINFENDLAMALIRQLETQPKQLVIEDEGRNIGSVNLPADVFDALKGGERVVVETPLAERIAITLDEYVVQAQNEYASLEDWIEFMLAAFGRIKKRLGGERYQRVLGLFETAMNTQQASGSTDGHQTWIETLLTEYYDPMYDYQMQKRQHAVAFTGSIDEVVAYLKNQS